MAGNLDQIVSILRQLRQLQFLSLCFVTLEVGHRPLAVYNRKALIQQPQQTPLKTMFLHGQKIDQFTHAKPEVLQLLIFLFVVGAVIGFLGRFFACAARFATIPLPLLLNNLRSLTHRSLYRFKLTDVDDQLREVRPKPRPEDLSLNVNRWAIKTYCLFAEGKYNDYAATAVWYSLPVTGHLSLLDRLNIETPRVEMVFQDDATAIGTSVQIWLRAKAPSASGDLATPGIHEEHPLVSHKKLSDAGAINLGIELREVLPKSRLQKYRR
ncbi:hypothetical protein BC940DRAFT_337492 [Gongronella butleri]|nr:hypothetical protein BC940DRAFT_337492 [Gongronella butleri]